MKGISFKYVLNEMVYSEDEWFVDASTTWGVGGCAGTNYFSVQKKDLVGLNALFQTLPNHEELGIPRERLPIAYI